MSIVRAYGYQVGTDPTPSNNFSLLIPTTPDGTFRLSRGNVGSTTADIFTVGADNNITFNYQVNNAYGNSEGAYRRNKLDNAMFQINQRGQGLTTSGSIWIADRWVSSHNISTQVSFYAQGTSSLAGGGGFMQLKCTATISPSAGQYAGILQSIEGLRINDLRWGFSNALPVTLSFYAYATTAGTYSISIRNAAGTRSYIINWSPTILNTWIRYSFVIPGDTVGTWVMTSAASLSIFFTGTSGTTYQAPAASSWQAGNYLTAPGATGMTTAVNQEVNYAGIQLEAGSSVTPFEIMPYADDLIQCQRYFELVEGTAATNQPFYLPYQYKVTKRGIPTVALYSGGTGGANFDNGNNSLSRLRCPVAVLATSNIDWILSSSAEI